MVERVRRQQQVVSDDEMEVHRDHNSRVERAVREIDSRDRVNVACKLPNGLLLRLFMIEKRRIASPTGSQEEIGSRQVGPEIRLNGFALAYGQIPNYPIIGGYAITKNVPKAFFEAWLAANHDADYVRNKLVFAYSELDRTEGQAKDLKDKRSGLEPINPNKLPPTGNQHIKLETYQKEN